MNLFFGQALHGDLGGLCYYIAFFFVAAIVVCWMGVSLIAWIVALAVGGGKNKKKTSKTQNDKAQGNPGD